MVAVPPIRKKDVSPEVWAAHRAKEKAREAAAYERERIAFEADVATYQQQRVRQISELRWLWQEMRSEIQNAPSLIGFFERFEQSLLSLLKQAMVDEDLVAALLDDPMFPDDEEPEEDDQSL
jgi:sugar-specific transcriptional regulator TrmB